MATRPRRLTSGAYGGTKGLKIGSGLRVGEDGVSCNHHFLPPSDISSFVFIAGEYAIETYAKILNQHKPVLLSTVRLSVSSEIADALCDRTMGALFTWRPDLQEYRGDVSAPVASEGRSRSVSGTKGAQRSAQLRRADAGFAWREAAQIGRK